MRERLPYRHGDPVRRHRCEPRQWSGRTLELSRGDARARVRRVQGRVESGKSETQSPERKGGRLVVLPTLNAPGGHTTGVVETHHKSTAARMVRADNTISLAAVGIAWAARPGHDRGNADAT